MQDLTGLALSLLDGLSGSERRLLGVLGAPGSGKTTLAEILVAEVNQAAGHEVAIEAPMDGFHLQDEQLLELGILPLKGIPASFDAYLFVGSLGELRRSPLQVVPWPAFDRATERSLPGAITIGLEHKLVVVSGNYLLLHQSPWNQAAGLLDETWFVDAPLEVLYARLVCRHMAGGKSEEDARAKVASTDMPNAHLVLASRTRATRVVTFDVP
jgi:pantothenate kinase